MALLEVAGGTPISDVTYSALRVQTGSIHAFHVEGDALVLPGYQLVWLQVFGWVLTR
tara:strand:- start:378 stop:548 length:171 start_codon:yes stop_codon:yes gene_type:complete